MALPHLHHAPVSTAREGEALAVVAELDHPEVIRAALLVFRSGGGELTAVPFLRGGQGYVATIPGAHVHAPELAYTIELETVDGARSSVFATRDAPHPVQVREDYMDASERAILARLGKSRSVASVSSEYVRFGTTTGAAAIPCATGQTNCAAGQLVVPQVDDQYYRVEASYTYRPFRTVAEFSLRGGLVRGTSLVASPTLDQSKYNVGLNYGGTSVTFRLASHWHLEGEALLSISEVGFLVGLGNSLVIGDLYGSRLTLGYETIGLDHSSPSTYFGTRIYSRLDVMATDRVRLAPIVEVTDMPHAASFGVRLLAEAVVEVGHGLSLTARGGYQARKSTSGGPAVGGTAQYAF